MSDLPNWVYDVVCDLLHQEEVHPKLLFESGAFEGTRVYDWCPASTLAMIPAEVQQHAAVLMTYLDRQETPKHPKEAE